MMKLKERLGKLEEYGNLLADELDGNMKTFAAAQARHAEELKAFARDPVGRLNYGGIEEEEEEKSEGGIGGSRGAGLFSPTGGDSVMLGSPAPGAYYHRTTPSVGGAGGIGSGEVQLHSVRLQ